MADQALNIRLSLSGVQGVVSGLNDIRLRVSAFSRSLGTTALGLAGIGGIGAALVGVIRTGVDFNATLEQAKLGIAAVQRAILPQTYTTFDQAMAASTKAVALLEVKARESAATFEELVDGFQSLTGAATEANIPLEKQVDLITTLSNAVSGLGLPSHQLTQESRALLTGNITRDAVVARRLNITPEDIRAAKEAGQLYEFLTKKLEAFAEAGRIGQTTFRTLASNVRDAFTQAAAAATLPIFQEFKGAMASALREDWKEMGKRIGDFVATGISSWKGGSFDQFLSVSIAAAFEEGVQRLAEMLSKLFALDGGLWPAIQRWLVSIGFALRSTLMEAVDWALESAAMLASDAYQQRAAEATRVHRAALEEERKAALATMGGGFTAGTTNREQLSAMVAEQRRRREELEAEEKRKSDAIELAPMTVQTGVRPEGQFDPNSFRESFTVALASIQNEWGTWALQTANAFKTVFESAISSISNGITGLILRTKTWGQALREIGATILSTVVQSIVQMGVRWVLTRIMMATVGRAIGAAEMAATIGMNSALAASLAAIWATPATLATTATYGSAAAAAPGIISASIAATKGISVVSQVGGMATGGLTPGKPTLTFVGEEGPEFVVNAGATRRNRGVLEAINSGANITTIAAASSASRSGSASSAPQEPAEPTPVKVHLFFDRREWIEASRDQLEAIAVDALRRKGL